MYVCCILSLPGCVCVWILQLLASPRSLRGESPSSRETFCESSNVGSPFTRPAVPAWRLLEVPHGFCMRFGVKIKPRTQSMRNAVDLESSVSQC